MARIKHYNPDTQQWEYSDIASIQQNVEIDYGEVSALINAATKNKANKSDLESHIANKLNPHAVTAEQIGAATTTYVDSLTKIYAQSNEPTNPKDGDIWIDTGANDGVVFATVATSGDYNDLINKPTIPTVSSLASDGMATQTYVNQAIAAAIVLYNGEVE